MAKPLRAACALLVAVTLWSAPARAIFVSAPAPRVREIPVERLLENLQRNAQNLSPAEQARAIGRVHLLAYLSGSTTLPVYRDRPESVAEGRLDDCSALDSGAPAASAGRERCVALIPGLGPSPEVPEDARGRSRPADDRLRAAIAAYTDAKALDPSNLRTRLALAFAYDRSQQVPLALDELRFVATEGMRQLPAPSRVTRFSDWEIHVVLSEAQQHLSRIATTPSDRQLAELVLVRLDAAPPAISITPILVPLLSHGSVDALIDRESPVAFDFSGQGLPMRAGWLDPKAAWLVWDPSRQASVTSGFQLFGSVTWMMFWTNGYQALGALDDDGDGRIAGHELDGLALWHDRDGDGITGPGEVRPVVAFGIASLGYAHERTGDDVWVSPDGVTFRDGRSMPTYDWLLRARPVRRPTQ